MRGRAASELGADLESALVRALRATWMDLNASHFRSKLAPPHLELSDASSRLGLWIPASRTIEIARRLVLEHPWGVVVEVLKHEMAHQWVHEGLGLRDEPSHGPSFRATCERLGIDASASGTPRAAAAETPETTQVLERISKLLALADSPNAHEAEAAMAAAQRLMLRYNVDLASRRAALGYSFRHLGAPTGRVTEAARQLASLLDEFFFVEAIWVHAFRPALGTFGRVLEVCGTQPNLEMASYVHDYLGGTAERLWREHKRAAGLSSDRDRRTFLAGVMLGFRDKLEHERTATRREGLVWVKDGDLHAYLRKRHPYVRTTRHEGHRRNAAHAEGRAAGRAIVLRKPVEGRPGGEVRLLGAARRT